MEAVRGGGAGLPGSCLRREAQWVETSGRNQGNPGQPEVLSQPSAALLAPGPSPVSDLTEKWEQMYLPSRPIGALEATYVSCCGQQTAGIRARNDLPL